MARGREEYLQLYDGLAADKAVEAVLEHFRDREERDTLYRFFEELEEAYEILSPDPFLRPYLPDYDELAHLYRTVRGSYDPGLDVDKSFQRKTGELVQQHTHGGVIRESRQVYELNEDALQVVADGEKPDIVKVFNLVKALHDLVAEKGVQQPFLIPIGERAQRIAELFENRQIDTERALQDFTGLVEETKEAERAWQESGLSQEAFAVFWFLRGKGVAGAEPVAVAASDAFAASPYWRTSPEQERQVRMALYKALIAAGEKARCTELVEEIITNLKRAGP
jgi:type I restriction enzyme, R subunit